MKSNNNTSKSKTILLKSFGFITVLIILMTGAWFFMTFENQGRIERILEEQTKMRAIFAMRDAALQRTIIMHRMVLLEDEFERDDEYMKLKERAGNFIQAREVFLHQSRSPSEKVIEIWRNTASNIGEATTVQAKVTELILDNEIKHANELLLNKAIPIQRQVMTQLTELLDIQRKKMEDEVSGVYQQSTFGLIFISIIASLAILWGIGIARYTIKRTTLIEKSLDEEKLKAQEADQQKSRFLANMSHEIRTPLTAIIGYSETLIEDKQTSSDWKQSVGSIIRNGKHLHQLINDILDLSKIEANQLSTEAIPVTVCKLANEIETLIGDRAKKKGIDFRISHQFPIPLTVLSDLTRLKQILINLCGNAIKFTAEGHITLNTRYDNAEEKLIFTIEDTGIGMTQNQIDSLFKPFKQADTATTREFGGTGLGLYISKQLTERLGGELLLESQPGTGSKFTVVIPANVTTDVKWVTSEEEINRLTQPIQLEAAIPILQGKILLAEDNADNQILISRHVRKTGATIKIVENGQQAVDAALNEYFDLILMDMQMPVMDGIEATKILRGKHLQTPIATLTANTMKKDAQSSQQAGANEFLTKPIDKQTFYNVLEKYLPAVSTSPGLPNESTSKNDLSDISDLVTRYINLLPETCAHIERLVNVRKWEDLKDEIHQLKGTGSAFGLPEITEQCTDIEKHLLASDYKPAQRLISKLAETCRDIAEKHTPLQSAENATA